MRISFHGAAGGVTGSCHLVEAAGKKILVDCGLYQGSREIEEENSRPFGFQPEAIDIVLLTHAHLDHCGRLPLLVKQGFRGEIVTTAATCELARIVLLDAAHLQEEEARRKARWLERTGRRRRPVEPLYDRVDALATLDWFGRRARYGEPLHLAPGLEVVFHDAGHILGAAFLELRRRRGKGRKRVLFSGDLGCPGRPILRDPEPPPEADVVVMETTYGDRRHKPLGPSVQELYQAVNETLGRGGNVIIPSFALERAQEVLYYLREGVEQGVLPVAMQVFLDSPMAISATEVFRRHPECFDASTWEMFRNGADPFSLPGLHFTRETAESMALNQFTGGAVIIAGSGMCTGGRVRHHLKHNLWRREASVIFVGYAATGTLARQIIDGAERVHIFGEEIPVRAKVHTIGGFSAHADCEQLLAWHRRTGTPRTTFLVHGEEQARQRFARRLRHTEVVLPELHEGFGL